MYINSRQKGGPAVDQCRQEGAGQAVHRDWTRDSRAECMKYGTRRKRTAGKTPEGDWKEMMLLREGAR